MKTRHSRFFLIVLLVSLLRATAIACPPPSCPECQVWGGSSCVWSCGSSDYCCPDMCCSRPCCERMTKCCDNPLAECCGFDQTCCDNVCAGNTCCEPGQIDCDGCWSGLCCGGDRCNSSYTVCCGSALQNCCEGECCNGTMCCGAITGNPHECCENTACYDTVDEKCCGNGDGTICDKAGGECCDESGCVSSCPGGECCDDGTCTSSCPTNKCCDDGVCVSECSGDKCCDEGVCEALEGCESCIYGYVVDDDSKCEGCESCTDAVCDDDDANCDPGDVCVEGTCCDTAGTGCTVNGADIGYNVNDCVKNVAGAGQCTGGWGTHIAFGWTQTPTHQNANGPGTVDVAGCANVTYAQCKTIFIGVSEDGPEWDCILDIASGNITAPFGTHDECPSE